MVDAAADRGRSQKEFDLLCGAALAPTTTPKAMNFDRVASPLRDLRYTPYPLPGNSSRPSSITPVTPRGFSPTTADPSPSSGSLPSSQPLSRSNSFHSSVSGGFGVSDYDRLGLSSRSEHDRSFSGVGFERGSLDQERAFASNFSTHASLSSSALQTMQLVTVVASQLQLNEIMIRQAQDFSQVSGVLS